MLKKIPSVKSFVQHFLKGSALTFDISCNLIGYHFMLCWHKYNETVVYFWGKHEL